MKKPGDRVDRYVIETVLGRGGMGEVYEAQDTRLGRRVALKLIRGDAGDNANQRLVREARTAAAFEHTNAVVIYDVGEAEGQPFIAMELVRGKSLRVFVGDERAPIGRRLRWLVDAARALGAAHRAGLVHRDVKPDNVMIREDGRVKVLDFGIARRQQSTVVDPSAPTAASAPDALATLTERGVIVGTPRYAPPEQLRSEPLDGRADQFAWGVMAHELLTGSSPWKAEDALGLLSQILSGEVVPLRELCPDAPEEVERVITRTLSKRAADRYPSIDEVADAIEPFADATSSSGGARRDSLGAGEALRETPGGASRTAIRADTEASTARRALRGTARVGVWVLAAIGGLMVVLIAIAAATGSLHIDRGSADAKGAPVVVQALRCGQAKLEGDGASAELARAIGIGACARLAVDIGVDWSAPTAAHELQVKGKLGASSAEVELAVGERTATGKGPTPLDAMVDAIAALGKQVAAPPATADEIHAWGAKDAASARHIERVWRRLVLNVAPNDEAAIKELLANDPESPWPYILDILVRVRGSAAYGASLPKALALVDKLPPPRARGMRGALLYLRSPADHKEGMQLLRQSYAEAPDDADVAGIYAAVAISEGATEEGFAVADRLYARWPTRSIVPLNNAINTAVDHNLERDAKYLDRLHQTFPESLAWDTTVTHLVIEKKFDEARRAVSFGQKLGITGASTGGVWTEYARAWVEFAAMQPRAAREIATAMLGDPRGNVTTSAAELIIATYMLEGRVIDGESAELREIDRQRSSVSPFVASFYVVDLAQQHRWLGRPPPDPKLLEWVEHSLGESVDYSPQAAALVRVELALAKGQTAPKEAKKIAERTLAEIEGSAERLSDGQRGALDGILVSTIPLVRVVRGDAEAAKRWYATERAPWRRRRFVALEAGLVLEATGDKKGAEQAYLLAQDPIAMQTDGFATLASHIRLAELYRGEGRDADAAKIVALLDRLCANADPGLRDAIRKVR